MEQQGAFLVMFTDLLNFTKLFLQVGKKFGLFPLWEVDTWDFIFLLFWMSHPSPNDHYEVLLKAGLSEEKKNKKARQWWVAEGFWGYFAVVYCDEFKYRGRITMWGKGFVFCVLCVGAPESPTLQLLVAFKTLLSYWPYPKHLHLQNLSWHVPPVADVI